MPGKRRYCAFRKRTPREGEVFDEDLIRRAIVDECPPGFVEIVPGVFYKDSSGVREMIIREPSHVDDEQLN